MTQLVAPTEFVVEPLDAGTLPAPDKEALLAFQKKTGELQRALFGANEAAKEAEERVKYVKATIENTPALDHALWEQARSLELRLKDLREKMVGDRTKTSRMEPDMPGIASRVNQVVYGHWSSTSAATDTHRKQYEIAAKQFGEILDDLRAAIEVDLVALEQQLEDADAPWTPGRGVPDWEE
jgi:hypothetical protein